MVFGVIDLKSFITGVGKGIHVDADEDGAVVLLGHPSSRGKVLFFFMAVVIGCFVVEQDILLSRHDRFYSRSAEKLAKGMRDGKVEILFEHTVGSDCPSVLSAVTRVDDYYRFRLGELGCVLGARGDPTHTKGSEDQNDRCKGKEKKEKRKKYERST
jgi:hypothetical protein